MASNVERIDTKTPEMDHLLMVYGMANAASVLNKAMELEIFELLYKEKEPISAEELAAKNKFKPGTLTRLLNCLTAIKVVSKTKKDGKELYRNTKAGDLLSKSYPDTFKSMPMWSSYFKYTTDELVNNIKISETNKEEKPHEEEDFDWEECEAEFDFYQGFHNFLVPQAKTLVTHYDLSQYKSCVDLGGGTGVIAFELRRNYPKMDVSVMDMKNVVKLAKERFVPGNEQLGVKFISGNFFKTDFPKVDLFIVCRTLRTMSEKEVDDLISKCHQNLNPGGALLAFEQLANEERDGSVSAMLHEMTAIAHGSGLLTPSEYRTLFTKHGFTDIKFTFTQDWNEYDIIYAKKA